MRSLQKLPLSLFVAALAVAGVMMLAGPASAAPSEHPFELVPGSFQFRPDGRSGGCAC